MTVQDSLVKRTPKRASKAEDAPSLTALCHQLFQDSHTLAVMLSPDLRCTYVSPSHGMRTDWQESLLLGKGWLSHVHPEDREELLQLLQLCLLKHKGSTSFQCDYRFLHRDNRWHWYRADIQNSEALRCFDPKFLNGLMIISHDIGEFKVQQQRQYETRRSEALIEECRKTMLSHVSHELRTPLNAILGFAELMQLNVKPEARQAYVGHIIESSYTMLKAVEELLAVNASNAYETSLCEGTHDVRDLMQQVSQECAAQGQTLSVNTLGYAIWAYVDGSKLTRAIVEICAALRAEKQDTLAVTLIPGELGALDICFMLGAPVSPMLEEVMVTDRLSETVLIAPEHLPFIPLVVASQVLRQHQAPIEITPKTLTITLPTSRVLSARDIGSAANAR